MQNPVVERRVVGHLVQSTSEYTHSSKEEVDGKRSDRVRVLHIFENAKKCCLVSRGKGLDKLTDNILGIVNVLLGDSMINKSNDQLTVASRIHQKAHPC